MTDVEQIDSDRKYSRLKLIMDDSETLDEFDRRVDGASARQTRLFIQYKKLKEKQAIMTTSRFHFEFVNIKGKKRRIARDRKGRFTKFKT